MATDLKLTFRAEGEKKISFTYPDADPAAEGADVKALMDSMVANGTIFADVPTAVLGAEFVTRTATPIAL